VGQLENDGHLTGEKLAERTNWTLKKLGKYANGIVDGWDRSKEIKGLWRDFKGQLQRARDMKQERWG
jgi:hypothetical protein